jgi:carboxyl-terminal processing protease
MGFVNSYLVTKYAPAIIVFSLALLMGCDDNNKKSNASSSSSSAITSFSSSSSSSSSSSAIASDARYTGEWYASAYGSILSITAEQGRYAVKTYSLTKDYCLLQDINTDLAVDELKQKYGYSNSIGEKLLETRGHYSPSVEFKKIASLPNLCKENLQKLKGEPAYTFDAKKDFEIFWQSFNELYVNFDVRGVNWDEVYAEAGKSVADVKDEDELFDFLTALIEPLGDAHAILLKAPLTQDLFGSITAALDNQGSRLSSGATQPTLYEKLINEYLQTLEPGSEPTHAQMVAAREYFIANHNQLIDTIFSYADKSADIKMRANGKITWFTTSDNIGYLFIGSMSDLSEGDSPILDDVVSDVAIAEATIKEALNDLANTKGLIVDVRFNDGGHDEVSLTFVRHFINQPQVVYSKFAGKGASTTPVKNILLDPQPASTYIKPTAVLISGDSVSAAEVFAIAMLSLPQVTLIGEQTAGAFSDILIKRLTSDIAFGISNETYLDTQGKNYEGIGIPPDIAIPFATQQERNGGYDAGLDKAIEWIKSAP